MNLTERQHAAVEHRGSSLLVTASAGSGKTEVLAQRCVSLIADAGHPCGIDRILAVTFTRAAAAELRVRVGRMLRDAAHATTDRRLRQHLRRQDVLLDSADIGTIDSWCATIVREHFASGQGGIDPAFAVLSSEQAMLLRGAVADELIEWVCTSDEAAAVAGRDCIARHTKPSDAFLRDWVLALNRYREHLVNPDQWFAAQRAFWSSDEATFRATAEKMLAGALIAECEFQRRELGVLLADNEALAVRTHLEAYHDQLGAWAAALTDATRLAVVSEAVSAFRFARKPRGLDESAAALLDEVKGRWFEKRLKKRLGADCVADVLEHAEATAALVQTLLQLEQHYRGLLEARKRALGAYEFGDVLRLALDLLGTPGDGQRRKPTTIAAALQRRYEHILVDEYQDTSPVQVELLRLVTRGQRGCSNRFMVGDVKQSIYGFREAEPRLFAELIEAVSQKHEEGRVLLLSDNFRTHTDLLAGLNKLFWLLFAPALGGTTYGRDEWLQARRDEIANATLDRQPRGELHLVLEKTGSDADSDDTPGDAAELPLERIEREGQVAAERIAALFAAGVQIPQRGSDGAVTLRPLQYKDVVVLLRSAKGNAPRLASVLRKAGIPSLAIGRESILDSLDVQDVRNALTLIANRRQDVPLVAHLRGPMVGLSEPQLLDIRRVSPDALFYEALEAYRTRGADGKLRARLDDVVARLDRWRAASRTAELPQLLGCILRETDHVHFARALPAGEHRVAMLRALESLAQEFAAGGRRGVGEFVEYLDALTEQDVRPDATAAIGEDVVRIMTIHAAKGLEFPVVFLLGAGAAFSRRPQRGTLCCDEKHGVGIEFLDYPARAKLVSAPYLLGRQAEAQRELEEELRLLYVAATRARECFAVIGHTSEGAWNGVCERFGGGVAELSLISRLSAGSMLEWMMMGVAAGKLEVPSGDGPPPVRVMTHAAKAGPLAEPEAEPCEASDASPLTVADRQWVERGLAAVTMRLDTALANMPAVLSVSAAKRQAASRGEDVPRTIEHAATLAEPAFARAEEREDGLRVGNAYHRFMQFADLKRLGSVAEVTAEMARLVAGGALPAEEAALLEPEDFVWLARTSEGRLLTTHAETCRREVPFVYGLPVSGGDERVVLRGIIDCLVETGEGLVILDYKTDRLRAPAARADAWDSRIAGYSLQLQLYATAAVEVFARPVAATALLFLRERQVVSVPPSPPAIGALLARLEGGA